MPVYPALQPAQQKSGLAPTDPCDLPQCEVTVYSGRKSKARHAEEQLHWEGGSRDGRINKLILAQLCTAENDADAFPNTAKRMGTSKSRKIKKIVVASEVRDGDLGDTRVQNWRGSALRCARGVGVSLGTSASRVGVALGESCKRCDSERCSKKRKATSWSRTSGPAACCLLGVGTLVRFAVPRLRPSGRGVSCQDHFSRKVGNRRKKRTRVHRAPAFAAAAHSAGHGADGCGSN